MVIASDSQVSHGNKKFTAKKLFELAGEAVGMAGNMDSCAKFIGWYSAGCDSESVPEFDKDDDLYFEALVLDKSGRLMLWDTAMLPQEVLDDFYAIGSGSQAALGAMRAGATVERAIAIASEIDLYTDCNIVAVSVIGKPFRSSENGWDA